MKLKAIATLGAVTAMALGLGLGASAASAAATVKATVYDATESPLPGNVPSEGAEAYSFDEFGDAVNLDGTARTLTQVSVVMSSWGCENGYWYANNCSTGKNAKFSEPITMNVYAAPVTNGDGTVSPGRLLTTVTNTFAIPYRPSADLRHCNTTNDAVGRWYDKKSGNCYNGKAVKITFNFSSLRLTLPDSVVIGIAYDTTHHGYDPIGEDADCYQEDGGCGYDSLNVGLNDSGAPSVGSEAYPGDIFETLEPGSPDRCDATPADNEFQLNSPTSTSCWTPYVPEISIAAKGPAPAA